MPNWTENTLEISVPAKTCEALVAALRGPDDWPIPLDAFHEFEIELPDLNNHQKVQIEGRLDDPEAVIAAFHAHVAPYGWPSTLKPSRSDLVKFLVDPESCTPEMTDFSVAKLAPYAAKSEHEAFLPCSDPASPFWIKGERSARATPIIDLRYRKLGTKWPPSEVEVEVEGDGEDRSFITIKYQTPNSPIRNIIGLMREVLGAHDAKMLLTWVEEQGLCGFSYFDPANPETENEDQWSFDNDWVIEEVDEDDPDASSFSFDHIGFSDHVRDLIDDPCFN